MRLWTACVLATSILGHGCADDDDEQVLPISPLDSSFRDAASDGGAPDATTCVDSIGLEDFDRDGFSRAMGDCDDCDIRRGPGALELPNNGIDEDCSGADATSTQPMTCDLMLKPDDSKVDAVVKALGLCGDKVGRGSFLPGLIDARYVTLAGGETLHDNRQVWLPELFGTIPAHEGSRMVVLSTGVARDFKAKDFTPECDVFGSEPDATGNLWSNGQTPPTGFPRDSSQCKDQEVSSGALAYDDVGLELTLRAPGNATALVFDSMFFTYEYPDFVCSRYNDFFVALLDPVERSTKDRNVVVDDQGDPIGVNTGLLAVCSKTNRAGRDIACTLGPEFLKGTGYGKDESTCAPLPRGESSIGGASTGWLHTEIPVVAGSVLKLRFVLWDSGDPLLDSSVVLDNLRFVATPAVVGTKPITAR